MALGMKWTGGQYEFFCAFIKEDHSICQFSVLYRVFKRPNLICLDQQYTHILRIQLLTMANACRVVQALPNFTLLISKVSSMSPPDVRLETRAQKSAVSLL